ncbi:MAG: hypothetical protein HYT81_04050 [Gemmatimonadetes bacterium]|nr:hypothetical protein [Gemmatimonadota bacterium]
MSSDKFEDFVRRAAREYHRPPEAPREQLWARIVAERLARRHERQLRQRRQVHWWGWAAAAAAVLAVGIGIGRAIGPRPAPRPSGMQMAEAPPGAGEQVPAAFEIAALDHLRHVETFLMVFQSAARAGSAAPETSGLARDLLMNTRLLMDSPAGRDPRMAALLDDIEVMLAQIASYADRPEPSELQLIAQGIEQRGLLSKLRTAVPAEYSVLSAQGVL